MNIHTELLTHILSFCDVKTITNCECTSKELQAAATDKTLWELISNSFGFNNDGVTNPKEFLKRHIITKEDDLINRLVNFINEKETGSLKVRYSLNPEFKYKLQVIHGEQIDVSRKATTHLLLTYKPFEQKYYPNLKEKLLCFN